METTIICWVYIAIMEKKMEAAIIICWGYIGNGKWKWKLLRYIRGYIEVLASGYLDAIFRSRRL